eukprot:9235631-Pyramimonas_sp.AAC.1
MVPVLLASTMMGPAWEARSVRLRTGALPSARSLWSPAGGPGTRAPPPSARGREGGAGRGEAG